jgi:molecular chaperone GrpE
MSEDLATEVSDVAEVIEATEESIVEPGQETDPVVVLTADLQRVQAEYANYRKRIERDRSLAHELAISSVLIELIPVLDDIEGAKSHGELTGGFKAVADRIASTTERIGLTKYGNEGEVFDPQIHEALLHDTSPDVTTSTATKILQPGYKFKERILRPARVGVTDLRSSGRSGCRGDAGRGRRR